MTLINNKDHFETKQFSLTAEYILFGTTHTVKIKKKKMNTLLNIV